MKTTLIIALLLLIGFGIFLTYKHNTIKTEYITDTIRITKTYNKEKLIPYKVIVKSIDTIIIDSTHYATIPIETKSYNDTIINDKDSVIFKASLSGYKTSLDSINISVHSIQPIIVQPIKKQSRYSIGLHIGYGFTNKGFSPIIGIGLSYRLF